MPAERKTRRGYPGIKVTHWGNLCETCPEKSQCVFSPFANTLNNRDSCLIRCKEYSSGALIFTEGAPFYDVPIVCRGLALVSRVYSDGHEIVVHVARPGFILDLYGWRSGETLLSCSAEALGNATIGFLRSDLLEHEVQGDTRLARGLFCHAVSQLHELEAQYMKNVGMDVKSRVIYFLLQLADFYAPGSSSSVVLPFKLPRPVLAKVVGTAEETVSRIMMDLIRRGLLQKSQEALIIPNVTSLQSMLSLS